jgi:hypothetical protein
MSENPVANVTNVFKPIPPEKRASIQLINDCVFHGDETKTPYQSDVICKLFTEFKTLGVKGAANQGGFRYIKNPNPKPGETPYLAVILFSTGKQRLWRDESDNDRGVYVYYGDQNQPGKDILDTPKKGNKFLSDLFTLASSGKAEDRKKIPPVFIFDRFGAGTYDFVFRGLAIPGVSVLPSRDWLTAFYLRENRKDNPVLNFKALFTIANLQAGSPAYPNHSFISLEWLNDIQAGKAYESRFAPKVWKRYIDTGASSPITVTTLKGWPGRKAQLPDDEEGMEVLRHLYNFFATTKAWKPFYSFEFMACDLVQRLNPEHINAVDKTQDNQDGGIDGVGQYDMFQNDENHLTLSFFVQAKCYDPDRNGGVNTKDMARLISRIKTHDFGVMVTTSYIDQQTWDEVVADGHPLAFITGRDIVMSLKEENVLTAEEVDEYLNKNYGWLNTGKPEF